LYFSENRDRGIRARLFLPIVMLLLVAGSAAADSATTSHDITIGIGTVKMLEVHNSWATQHLESTTSGGNQAVVTTSYGVTCLGPDIVIRATLTSPIPAGVVVNLRMHSGIGDSLGWVGLGHGSTVNLVRDASGAERNVLEMEVTVPAGIALADVPIAIAYEIN
jgi:hypothetical protein